MFAFARARRPFTAAMLASAAAALSACNALTGIGDLTTATSSSSGGGHGGSGHTATSTHTTTGTGAASTGGGGSGGTSTGTGTTSDPCAGVTCSGHGTCSVQAGQATCTCQSGYHAVGADCVIDETCAGKQCGHCGSCKVQNGVATCTCPADYAWDGKDCKLAVNPCASANCGPDQACVPEAHCSPLGACVQKCDCSNCPNCGPDNSDGRWNDWQEYCGAPVNQSPATMTCNKPCPSGEGCLPFATPICWPIEGCFSL